MVLTFYTNNVSARVKAVVRVISISTKHEDQQRRNISLFCLCYYGDGGPAAVSRLLFPPSPIGNVSRVSVSRLDSFQC